MSYIGFCSHKSSAAKPLPIPEIFHCSSLVGWICASAIRNWALQPPADMPELTLNLPTSSSARNPPSLSVTGWALSTICTKEPGKLPMFSSSFNCLGVFCGRDQKHASPTCFLSSSIAQARRSARYSRYPGTRTDPGTHETQTPVNTGLEKIDSSTRVAYRCAPWSQRPAAIVHLTSAYWELLSLSLTHSLCTCSLSLLILVHLLFFFLRSLAAMGRLLHSFILSIMLLPQTKDFWWRTPSWAEPSTPPGAHRVEHGLYRQRVIRALFRADV